MDKYTDEELAEAREQLIAEIGGASEQHICERARALRAEQERDHKERARVDCLNGWHFAEMRTADALRDLAALRASFDRLTLRSDDELAIAESTAAHLGEARKLLENSLIAAHKECAELRAALEHVDHAGARARLERDALQRRLDATVAAIKKVVARIDRAVPPRETGLSEARSWAMDLQAALAAAQPQADAPQRDESKPAACVDCGAQLNAGEAKCFTVCDACWDTHYAPTPAEPAALPEGWRVEGREAWRILVQGYGETKGPTRLVEAFLNDEGYVEMSDMPVPAAVLRALLSLPAPDESARVRELAGLLREALLWVNEHSMFRKRIDAALARKDGDE